MATRIAARTPPRPARVSVQGPEAPVGVSGTPAHRLDIQGLRGVAVLLVVLFHAGVPLHGGFTGVDVFFVISGFVITQLLLRDLVSQGRMRFARFYARRAKRLLPALAVVLAFVAVVGTLASPVAGQRTGALTGVFAALFGANGYLYQLRTGYFDVSTELNPLLHTWTLAVEEQFYVVFPALLAVGWRLAAGRSTSGRRLGAACVTAAVAAASFVLSLAFSYGHAVPGLSSPERFAYYGSPTRAWEFALGCVLALGLPWLGRIPRAAAELVGAAGLVLVLCGAVVLNDRMAFPGFAALVPTLGAGALLVAGSGPARLAPRALEMRWLVRVGDLSYSWYLWHWPLIVFGRALLPGSGVGAALGAAVSLLPAWLSYRFVENPIRYSPRIRGRRVLALAAACIGAAVVANVGLYGASRALASAGAMHEWTRSQQYHADFVRGCSVPTPLAQHVPACTWRPAVARGQVVLLGDSNAGHFTEPFVAAALRAHLTATVATLPSCPFVDLDVLDVHTPTAECRGFYDRTMAELVRRPPTLAVLAARTDDYVEKRGRLATPAGARAADPAAKARLWQEALTRTLARLNRAGIGVIVVHPAPELPYAAEDCAVVRVLLRACRPTVGRAQLRARLRRSIVAENAAIAATRKSFALDVDRALCGSTSCAFVRSGTMLYRDPEHLSIAGAKRLDGVFYAAFRRALRAAR